MIIEKSDQTNDKYDKIVFARRDIKEIIIPLQITKIGEGSFFKCKQFQKVEISKYSELEIIENFSFSETSIEEINIPTTVKFFWENFCDPKTKITKFEPLTINETNTQPLLKNEGIKFELKQKAEKGDAESMFYYACLLCRDLENKMKL